MGRREDRPLGRSVMVIPVAVRRRVRPVRALRARRFRRSCALYEEYGKQGLRQLEPSRSKWKAGHKTLETRAALIDSLPSGYGHCRKPLVRAIELHRRTGLRVHATALCRCLELAVFAYR